MGNLEFYEKPDQKKTNDDEKWYNIYNPNKAKEIRTFAENKKDQENNEAVFGLYHATGEIDTKALKGKITPDQAKELSSSSKFSNLNLDWLTEMDDETVNNLCQWGMKEQLWLNWVEHLSDSALKLILESYKDVSLDNFKPASSEQLKIIATKLTKKGENLWYGSLTDAQKKEINSYITLDTTTNPTEDEEEDIPGTPRTTTPWATDWGEVNTGWSAEQWGEWQSWSQSGDRPWWESISTSTEWQEWWGGRER